MCRRLIALLLVLLMLSPAAHAGNGKPPVMQPRNTTSITLYDQDPYTEAEWALYGRADRCLGNSGCFAFAYAHASQWLMHEKRDDDLLRELVAVCRDPNGNYGHRGCHHSPMEGQAYYPYNRMQGFPIVNGDPPWLCGEDHMSVGGVQRYFRTPDQVLCLHGAGHHIVAVEEKTIGGVSYTHVLDSHWGSVQMRAYIPYFFLEKDENGREYMQGVTVDPATEGCGCDYWMETERVVGFFEYLFSWKLNPAWTPRKN